jgi:nucleoporin NUP42
MRKDLGDDRPRWILSAYGGSKDTPASLFEGNEYSPEEVRWRFYELASKGQEAQADQEASQLWAKADQDFKDALSRVNDVQKYMQDAEKKHPNRYDYTKMDGTTTKDEFTKSIETTHQVVQSQSSGFGAGSGFGQSSASANPFGKPAVASFGQASGPSAFGSSPFGKPAASSAFGQPAFSQSAAGPSTSSSAFGQPAAPSAFGQPAAASAFGKPAFGQGFSSSSPFAPKPQTSAPAVPAPKGDAACPNGELFPGS